MITGSIPREDLTDAPISHVPPHVVFPLEATAVRLCSSLATLMAAMAVEAYMGHAAYYDQRVIASMRCAY